MPNFGGAAAGAATGAALGNIVPGIGTGLGAVAGGLFGLFSGGDDKNEKKLDTLTSQLDANTAEKRARATQTYDRGMSIFDELNKYYGDIFSGDRDAMTNAISPQIGRVSDQYDSAYKAIAQNAPRGGGRNSALIGLRSNQARDIGDLYAGTRKEAAGELESLMGQLFGLSDKSDASSLGTLGSQLDLVLQQLSSNRQAQSQLGQALGTIIAAKIKAGGGK